MNAGRLTARQALDRHFLEVRGKLLEVAASLDRIHRGDGYDEAADDPRIGQIDRALEALAEPGFDRAERLQMIFSLPYDPKWRETLRMPMKSAP